MDEGFFDELIFPKDEREWSQNKYEQDCFGNEEQSKYNDGGIDGSFGIKEDIYPKIHS